MNVIQATCQQLLREEIERIITDAKADGETLQTAAHAAILFATYPGGITQSGAS